MRSAGASTQAGIEIIEIPVMRISQEEGTEMFHNSNSHAKCVPLQGDLIHGVDPF
jgi:hypothetical protein